MKFVFSLLLIVGFVTVQAQTVAGLWRGRFTSNNALQLTTNYKYELLIFQEGNKLSGFSYSTLLDGKFYAVCDIKGTLFDGYMVITETKTVYENPPADNNNFQTHILFLNAEGKEATGDWKLTTKNITQLFQEEGKTFLKKEEDPSQSGLIKILEQNNAVVIKPSTPSAQKETALPVAVNYDSLKLATRPLNILQTISIRSDSVLIELYDDGLIDGDSVSIFCNNNVLLNKVALSEKGLKQTIPITTDQVLIISLYAENQGTIPPNTGVLIIRADDQRYEIRFTSDTKQSAAVRIQRL